MALDPTRMAMPIKVALVAAGAIDGPATQALALGIATAVVAELLAFAIVVPTALISTPLGGPVTGIAKIT